MSHEESQQNLDLISKLMKMANVMSFHSTLESQVYLKIIKQLHWEVIAAQRDLRVSHDSYLCRMTRGHGCSIMNQSTDGLAVTMWINSDFTPRPNATVPFPF